MCKRDESARKPWACAISILSGLVIIAGILMLVFAILFTTKQDDIMAVDLGEVTASIDAFKSVAFGILLAVSFVAIGTGIGGTMCLCGPCKKASCCWAIIYSVPLFVAWLAYLIVGIVVTGVSTKGLEEISSFCTGDVDNEQLQWIGDAIEDVDSNVNAYASTFMCSEWCKCDTADTAAWRAFDNTYLADYGRVFVQNRGNSDLADADGHIYMVYNGGAQGYSTFADCNQNLQSLKENDDTGVYDNIPEGDVIDWAIKAITYFEGKYTCSGICNPGLFYYSLDVEAGPPTKSCLQFMKTEIGDRMTYLGVASLVIGILLLLVFLLQYCLWCRYD